MTTSSLHRISVTTAPLWCFCFLCCALFLGLPSALKWPSAAVIAGTNQDWSPYFSWPPVPLTLPTFAPCVPVISFAPPLFFWVSFYVSFYDSLPFVGCSDVFSSCDLHFPQTCGSFLSCILQNDHFYNLLPNNWIYLSSEIVCVDLLEPYV